MGLKPWIGNRECIYPVSTKSRIIPSTQPPLEPQGEAGSCAPVRGNRREAYHSGSSDCVTVIDPPQRTRKFPVSLLLFPPPAVRNLTRPLGFHTDIMSERSDDGQKRERGEKSYRKETLELWLRYASANRYRTDDLLEISLLVVFINRPAVFNLAKFFGSERSHT